MCSRSAFIKIGSYFAFVLSLSFLAASSGFAQNGDQSSESWNELVRWRSIGPANMMGRITSIAVYPGDKNIWWAASAGGGLLKTTNNGTSFEHQFDDQATVSIGDVQVAATDPNLLWVGTGEANPRNSVSWGDGVYKSTDGGKTWKNMGLKKTFQTGRIAIHPEDHDIVYVGALGRLWGPNEERGLYKTADGGKSWKKVFYVDDKTGVVDVQVNPVDPNELVIATYERMRDGFDANDPIKKYGDGSGIYKSVDAGKTFVRLTKGLPSCKLGRIGLNYFKSDPNFIAAIVESEKIATEPKDIAYAGLRGENAEVGAKITQVTDNGPSAKAGLKENDIVVSVDGAVLYSYSDLLKEFRMRKAGDTIKLIVSRERKPVDVVIELGKRPEQRGRTRGGGRGGRGGRNGRNPFTGTLGGQAANLQGQQGENEEEFGGIYLSSDGGDSWERINTLNPRPMYYSQIRVDPVDKNRMYVLGTSLYRSEDAGETFTGDGGGREVHVDHHALWIDPDDPRHMILGNDGGIYVTHDRMKTWDHLNHVAIGQFYHVGIGSRMDYRVYGGLQDNGSWGGPVRAKNDSGTINSDWFRVGSGDGFITLVDPEDPDQIYFESQNGGMGRIHLETGERGFIRPRAPRGTRYRFNWKTPFLLSPHNSKIHYSAGNHVFRSYNKGNGVKAISPDITNTNKGAGSALTESPVQAGVLYVGTTDGAVWMTKDGGNNWESLYSDKKSSEDKKEAAESDNQSDNQSDKSAEKPAAKSKEAPSGEAAVDEQDDGGKGTEQSKPSDKIDGVWNGKLISERFPEGREPTITFDLRTGDAGEITGEIDFRRGAQEITSGTYDRETGELKIVVESQRGPREFTAKIKGDSMTGEMSARGGQFQIEFEATKQEDPARGKLSLALLTPARALISGLTGDSFLAQDDDPITGQWECAVSADGQGGRQLDFTFTLKLGDENIVRGEIESPRGTVEIYDGYYMPKTGKIYFTGERDNLLFDFEAVLKGAELNGDLAINDRFTAGFKATRLKSAEKDEAEGSAAQQEQEAEPAPQRRPRQPGQPRQPGFLGIALNGKNIARVVEDSGAEAAGLQVNDQIVSIDDQPVADVNALRSLLQNKSAGDQIVIVATRDGEEKKFDVVLGGRPLQAAGQGGQRRPQRPERDVPGEQQAGVGEKSTDAEQANADDAIAGTWTGTLTTQQGESSLSVVLKRSGDAITGTYETQRSDGEIVEGKYNEETKQLTLFAENERFTLEFDGKVSEKNYAGEIDFNGGTFSLEFELKKTGGAGQVAEKSGAAKPAGKSLKELLPGPRWVSSLHASKFQAARCYASFDGHRSNDDMPYIFVSENFGKSWNSIRGNLPDGSGSVRVIREDIKNENILYLGCEFGAWVSIDRGRTWSKFKNVPTVSVHEFAQHPELDDVVAATHGRSLWAGDVSMLRQIGQANKTNKLFKPRDVIMWRNRARRGSTGTRKFVAANKPVECRIDYFLPENRRDDLEIEIRDLQGKLLKRFDSPAKTKGFHSVVWNLRRANTGGGRFGGRIGSGDYLVSMRIGVEKYQRTLSVLNDPNGTTDSNFAEEEFTWWMYIGGALESID